MTFDWAAIVEREGAALANVVPLDRSEPLGDRGAAEALRSVTTL